MRPKKNIVLWAGDENRAGIMRFALETQLRVRVQVVSCAVEFERWVRTQPAVDLVVLLTRQPGPTADDARRVRKLLPFRPVVAIGSKGADWAEWLTDAVPQDELCMAELVMRARVWLAHKRGPKKAPEPAVAMAGAA